MKLSLTSSAVSPYIDAGIDLKTAFKAIRDCGYTHLDLDITKDLLYSDPREIIEILYSLEMVASMAHGISYNPLDPPENIDFPAMIADTLHYCKTVGIPQVVFHPGALDGNSRDEFFEKNIAFFKSLIPVAEESGITVLIENIGNYADPYFLWNGADLREMVDGVAHPLFAACWDVGHAHHFWPEDANQYDSIVALGDKLKALHIHENCGYFTEPRDHFRIDMHTLPYAAEGSSLSFDEVLQALKDIGYTGTFNFETNFPARKTRASFVYNGEKIKKLQLLPLDLWKKFNSALFDMGKYMLQTYDVFEE